MKFTMLDIIDVIERDGKVQVCLRDHSCKYLVRLKELEGKDAEIFMDAYSAHRRARPLIRDRVDYYECIANGVYSFDKHERLLKIRGLDEPDYDDEIILLKRETERIERQVITGNRTESLIKHLR